MIIVINIIILINHTIILCGIRNTVFKLQTTKLLVHIADTSHATKSLAELF